MEKQARKRPASRSDGEAEVKSARARTLDEDVEEFFAIIRRIRETSGLSGKADSNQRHPSFQLEDFAGCCASDGGRRAGSGRREGQSTSGPGDGEEGEGSEDNGVPAWRSLNVDRRRKPWTLVASFQTDPSDGKEKD